MRYVIIFLGLIIFTGCAQKTSFKTISSFKPGTKTIVLLDPDIEASEMTVGGDLLPRSDWTKSAQENLERAINIKINSSQNTIKKLDPNREKTEQETQVLKTISAIGQSVMVYAGPAALPTKKDSNDWYIGSSVKMLKQKYDADYGLLFYVRDQFTSPGRQATKIFAAFLGVQMAAAWQISFVALVDLEDGKIVWYNHRIAPDGDSREYEGAKELIDELTKDMPS